jgi:glyoxylase-like metal-dependent hydrolase (beta-lactamase superfamily II)
MHKIVSINAGGDANRSYVVLHPGDKAAWCVDPSYAARRILGLCHEAGCELTEIFLTHTHGDHIASLPELLGGGSTGTRVWVHKTEAAGVPGAAPIASEGALPGLPDVTAFFTPGHTPGGICYRIGNALFTGDVLFVDWIGRTDLPGGDSMAMFSSLARLRRLPHDLVIHPGHHYGSRESRSLGEEIQNNKFLACTDFDVFLSLLPELTA